MKDYGTAADYLITVLEKSGFTVYEMQELALVLKDKLDLMEKEAGAGE